MSSKEKSLAELRDKLTRIDDYLQQLDEDASLPVDVCSDFSQALMYLQNKHIPPELCSEEKLWERMAEAENLMEIIQSKVAEISEKKSAD